MVAELEAINRLRAALGSAARLDNALAHEDRLEFRDRTWTALSRPGHSPTDTVFLDVERGMALTGDHLMADFPANPYITRWLGVGSGSQLQTYMASLKQTLALNIGIALPGHGWPFADVDSVSERWRRRSDRLKAKLVAALSTESATAFELASKIAGRAVLRNTESVMSDVVGHLELLLEEGVIETHTQEQGTLRFVAWRDAHRRSCQRDLRRSRPRGSTSRRRTASSSSDGG